MTKTIGVIVLAFLLSISMSSFYIGYSRSGKSYQKKHRDTRRSVRAGSRYYFWVGHYGGGTRPGK